MEEFVSVERGLPPAPGEDQYLSLALANSSLALPGGYSIDLLGSPGASNEWLSERDLAPVESDMQEMCASQLRSLREQVRALFSARVAGLPALPAALSAINDALTRVPTAPLLHWDEKTGPYRAVPHPTSQVVDHALATLAADAADLVVGPDSERLTACGSSPCNRFFLRRGRRHWCSTRCGDRARAARAYTRRTQHKTD
ncbi:CGNR zinc finger domain-containing protein [Haloactinopolyspora alba]|uniref:CGNR zinc finger domain-containing protein n=1 Tax=Haloactinopolyspora alba TaxID=648780 RepID=UPI000D0D8DD1|nr:ABATE domain-containing protein [Haloactinopolyspora alba]